MYTTYRDAWVDTFKWSIKIALQAEVVHLLESRVNQISYGKHDQGISLRAEQSAVIITSLLILTFVAGGGHDGSPVIVIVHNVFCDQLYVFLTSDN